MKKFYMTMVAMLCGVAAMAQNEVYVNDFSAKAGDKNVPLEFCVRNTDPVTRVQVKFDPQVEGITIGKKLTMNEDRLDLYNCYIAADDDPDDPAYGVSDLFKAQKQGKNYIVGAEFAGYWNDNHEWVNVAFLGNDGVIFSMPVTVAATVADGAYTFEFGYKLVGTTNDPDVSPTNVATGEQDSEGFVSGSFTLTVGDGTGINSINADDVNAPVYNIAGQRVSKAQKGVFIQNGKKVAVK